MSVNADKICVIDGGVVKESGRQDELMAERMPLPEAVDWDEPEFTLADML